MQVFDLQAPTALDASPDGSWVVYARVGADLRTDKRTNTLWRLGVDGSNHRPLTGISAGPNGGRPTEYGAQISPDGGRVAFLSTASGSPQIHIYEVEGGTCSKLTDLVNPAKDVSWSPDGRWLAFHADVPSESLAFTKSMTTAPPGCEWSEGPYITDRLPYKLDGVGFLPRTERHLFIISATGGMPLRLTERDLGFGLFAQQPEWTPDGQRILVIGSAREDGLLSGRYSEIFEIDVARQLEPVRLTDGEGMVVGLAVSPDGSMVAFASAPEERRAHGHTGLFVLNRATGKTERLGQELDRELGQMPLGSANPIEWTPDSSAVYVFYNDLGNTKLGRFGVDGTHEIVLRDVAAGVSGYSSGTAAPLPDGRFVFSRSRGGEYPELYLQSGAGDEPARLTELNETLRRQHPVGEYEELWVENPADGQSIHAWLLKPADFDPSKPYPLILDIHGGPHADYGDRFWIRPQTLAGAGYCVLLANPRGSTSYGHDFALGIEYTYPGPDVGDLLAVVDHVAERPSIDSSRLFVMGGSGGGVLTAALVAATDQFRAAACLYPVIDWSSFMLNADITPAMRFWFEKMPWQDPQAYAARSLIKDIEKVTTPTVVICGAEDQRTPFGQAEIFYQALKFAGVESALVRFPGEAHGIGNRPAHNVQMLEVIVGWFKEHDGPAE